MKQNQGIISCDACYPAPARDVGRQSIQVPAQAWSREPLLRHQLNIALRRAPQHLRLRGSDRTFLAWMTWLWPSLLNLAGVVQPDTVLRWHRAGFRAYWHWKSRARRPGRPNVCRELRDLILRWPDG